MCFKLLFSHAWQVVFDLPDKTVLTLELISRLVHQGHHLKKKSDLSGSWEIVVKKKYCWNVTESGSPPEEEPPLLCETAGKLVSWRQGRYLPALALPDRCLSVPSLALQDWTLCSIFPIQHLCEGARPLTPMPVKSRWHLHKTERWSYSQAQG